MWSNDRSMLHCSFSFMFNFFPCLCRFIPFSFIFFLPSFLHFLLITLSPPPCSLFLIHLQLESYRAYMIIVHIKWMSYTIRDSFKLYENYDLWYSTLQTHITFSFCTLCVHASGINNFKTLNGKAISTLPIYKLIMNCLP